MKILISVNSFNFLVEPIESVIPFTINQNITNQLQNAFDDGDYVVIPDPVPTPLPVRSIDMRRLRLALLQMDLLDDIDAAISQQSRSAQIEWEYATDVKADHPLVVALATAMDLDIDAIFDLAETFT